MSIFNFKFCFGFELSLLSSVGMAGGGDTFDQRRILFGLN